MNYKVLLSTLWAGVSTVITCSPTCGAHLLPDGSALAASGHKGLDSATLRVFIGVHVPKSPLLPSCTVAPACQAVTSTCSSLPSLPGAFSFVLLPLCLITLYLHFSPCTFPSHTPLNEEMNLPPFLLPSLSQSFSMAAFSSLNHFPLNFSPLCVFPHTHLS